VTSRRWRIWRWCSSVKGVRATGATEGDGATMLARAGLAPVTLEAKEGLALINGTQAHTAVAALAARSSQRLWRRRT
jgi:histidine ammonia-lyase